MPQRTLSESEFNAIRDQVLASLPAGLSEADFNRIAPTKLAQAIGEAESLPAPAEGSAIGRFVSGAASMLNPVAAVEGIYNAVRHPIDTATQIGSDMAAQGQQAVQGLRTARNIYDVSTAIGHGAAAVMPIVGPAAAHIGEQIGTGDVSGGLGAAAGLIAPMAAVPAIRSAKAILSPATREAAAASLERGASARVADVMSPKVGPNKVRFGNMAEQVAPSLAKAPDGAAWSREGLHAQVSARLEQAEQALDTAANNRLNTRSFPTQPIINDLLEKKRALTAEAIDASKFEPQSGVNRPPLGKDVIPAPNRARVAEIDRAIGEIRQLGPVARYEPLRRIREAYDGPAKAVYSPAVTADFLKAQGGKLGAADVTGTLRESLAKFDPETATANAEYSLYRKADDVLSATAEVERTRPKVGRAIMARLTGSVVGEQAAGIPGAAAGFLLGPALDAAVSSGVTTKLQTAKLMTSLADAIRRGDIGHVSSLSYQLKKLAAQGAAVQQMTSPTTRTPPAGVRP